MLSEHFPQTNMYIYIYIYLNIMYTIYKVTYILFYEQNKKTKINHPKEVRKLRQKWRDHQIQSTFNSNW